MSHFQPADGAAGCVSELARRMEMSRALLYMRLTKLEEAGFITGHLELRKLMDIMALDYIPWFGWIAIVGTLTDIPG